MKNQYVGDINDFMKYRVLGALSGVGLRLIVCWMLTSDDKRGDGNRISYLNDETYRDYAPVVFDALKCIVEAGDRTVQAIESAEFLPARYYKRVSELSDYGEGELVFFDPDNGFEIKSIGRGKRGSERYLYWRDAAMAYSAGYSLMVYQHFPRVNRVQFMDELTEKVKANIGAGVVKHINTGSVDFVIIPQERHRVDIERATTVRGLFRSRDL